MASCLTANAGTPQAWITSLAVVTIRIFLVDRDDDRIVDFDQVVVAALLGRQDARRADLAARSGEVGQEVDALAFAAQVFVAPFPLHAGGLDRDVGARGVLRGDHGAGGGQRHADDDQERDDGPGDLDGGAFVERRRLVAQRLAVLEDGVEHDAEHRHEDHQADDHHPVVQRVDLRAELRHGCVQVQLAHGGTADAVGHLVSRPCRHTAREQGQTQH
jgi:hypothetical protein